MHLKCMETLHKIYIRNKKCFYLLTDVYTLKTDLLLLNAPLDSNQCTFTDDYITLCI